jgi:hypothetical protein
MTRIEYLYVLTATLLVAHQIDSAYWHEWILFGIPGGIQVFVLLNLPLLLLFLGGLVKVARDPRKGARLALALALVGVATFFIHAWFAWRGRPEFSSPTSWAVLGGTLLASLGLGWRAIGALRRRQGTM